MKKVGKITLIIISVLVLLTIIDLLVIFNTSKPLLAIKKDNYKYAGLFYDTYVCPELSFVSMKSKFTKFECAVNNKEEEKTPDTKLEIKSIQDETIGRTDLVFAQALEKFYEDETREYYFSCIKSSYVTVTYTNGTKETIKEALAKGNITMSDVNKYGIHYYTEFKR